MERGELIMNYLEETGFPGEIASKLISTGTSDTAEEMQTEDKENVEINPNYSNVVSQQLEMECINISDSDNSMDPLSSIVISHIETVVEETVTKPSSIPTSIRESPIQISVVPKRVMFNCNQCEFSASTRFALARHQSSHQIEVAETTGNIKKEQVFQCKHCSFRSKIRFALQEHSLRHSAQKKFHCQHCGSVATSRKTLVTHLVNSHKNYTTRCGVCLRLVPSQLKNEHKFTCDARNIKGKKKKTGYECMNCTFTATSKALLDAHHNVCNRKNKVKKLHVFKCQICQFRSTSKPDLKQHISAVHSENKLKCIHCDFAGKSLHSLNLHSIKSHSDLRHSCEKCSKMVPNQLMEDHRKKCEVAVTKEGETSTNYPCMSCSFIALSESKLNSHNKDHPWRRIVKCEKCDYRSFGRIVSIHFADEHLSDKVYKCKECSYTTNEKHIYKKHQQLHFLSDSGKSVKCQYCSFTTKYVKSLKKHLELHEVKKLPLVQCDQCDYKTPLRALKFHKAKAHQKATKKLQTFECGSCSFNTKNLLLFEKHYLVCKVTDGLLQCRHCSYKGHNSRALTYHSLVKHKAHMYKCGHCRVSIPFQLKNAHNIRCSKKTDNLKCHFCSYAAAERPYLYKHLRHHTVLNTPIIKCSQCNYKSTKRIVDKHRRSAHMSLPSFKCGYCSFSTVDKLGLESHVGIHSSGSLTEDVHHCEVCSFKTNDFKQFQDHLTSHSGSDSPMFDCPRCTFRSSIVNMISHCVKRHQLEMTPEGLKQLSVLPEVGKRTPQGFKQSSVHPGVDLRTPESLKQFSVLPEVGKTTPKGLKVDKITPEGLKQLSAFPKVDKQAPDGLKQLPIIGKSNQKFIKTDRGGDLTYKCTMCHETAKFRYQIKAHVLTHDLKKDASEESSSNESIGIIHSVFASPKHSSPNVTVSTNIVFICETCDFSTQSKDTLIQHKLTHTGEINPFRLVCELCETPFTSDAALVAHKCSQGTPQHCIKKNHANELQGSFRCPFCPLVTTYKLELQRHIFDCHNIDEAGEGQSRKSTYKCDTCDYETDNKNKLHNHVHVNINEVRVYKSKTYNVGVKGHGTTPSAFN